MDRCRTLILGGIVIALAIMSLAAPVSGADTNATLALVNGFPGKRVDVCLDGREIKSGLRYGGHVLRDRTGLGVRIIRFYERDPRRCKGTLLARKDVPLAAGEDLTIVLTKSASRIVTFSNSGASFFLGEIPPAGAPYSLSTFIIWRNASEMAVNFRSRYWSPSPEVPSTPSADPIFGKGQGDESMIEGDYVFQIRARLPEAAETLALARILTTASHRNEWLLVGTNPGNARFVALDRVVSQPSP